MRYSSFSTPSLRSFLYPCVQGLRPPRAHPAKSRPPSRGSERACFEARLNAVHVDASASRSVTVGTCAKISRATSSGSLGIGIGSSTVPRNQTRVRERARVNMDDLSARGRRAECPEVVRC
eukprot:31359-Pelagococcus_subviridis.AAC.4